jgi:hypothetical protein
VRQIIAQPLFNERLLLFGALVNDNSGHTQKQLPERTESELELILNE